MNKETDFTNPMFDIKSNTIDKESKKIQLEQLNFTKQQYDVIVDIDNKIDKIISALLSNSQNVDESVKTDNFVSNEEVIPETEPITNTVLAESDPIISSSAVNDTIANVQPEVSVPQESSIESDQIESLKVPNTSVLPVNNIKETEQLIPVEEKVNSIPNVDNNEIGIEDLLKEVTPTPVLQEQQIISTPPIEETVINQPVQPVPNVNDNMVASVETIPTVSVDSTIPFDSTINQTVIREDKNVIPLIVKSEGSQRLITETEETNKKISGFSGNTLVMTQ